MGISAILASQILDATLSGVNTGDQSVFSTIIVAGQDNVVADATNDSLTLVAGSGISITTDSATDTITVSAIGAGGASQAFAIAMAVAL